MNFAREINQFIQESAFKTPMTSPVVGTNLRSIRLDGDTRLTVEKIPRIIHTKYGGGLNIDHFATTDRYDVKGKLQTKAYWSDVMFLLNWAATLHVAGTPDIPWESTEPVKDLLSMTADHGTWQDDAGTYLRERFTGNKVTSWELSASSDSPHYMLTIEFLGSTKASAPDATAFPVPAHTDYPTDPVIFPQTTLTIGTSRTLFDSISISSTNSLNAVFGNSATVQKIRCRGRQTDISTSLYLASTPTDRATYEALTEQSVSLVLSDGTQSITFAFNANNVIETLVDSTPLEGEYMRAPSIRNQFDSTAGSDFTITYDDGV